MAVQDLILALIGAAVAVFATFALIGGRTSARVFRASKRVSCGQAEASDQLVKVSGVARTGVPLIAPATGKECIYYSTSVTTVPPPNLWRRPGILNRPTPRTRFEWAQFRIEDASGSLQVRVGDDADVRAARSLRLGGKAIEQEPVAHIVETWAGLTPQLHGAVVNEETIEPGATLLATGRIRNELGVVRLDVGKDCLITDLSERDLGRRERVATLVAALFLILGVLLAGAVLWSGWHEPSSRALREYKVHGVRPVKSP